MIAKKSGMYQVSSESGKPMGKYKSKKAAKKRIAQIEYWKRAKK